VNHVSARTLGIAALALFVVVTALEFTLPSRTLRWPLVCTFGAAAFIAIAIVGTAESRPDISDRGRRIAVWLSGAALASAVLLAFGVIR
jgi:bacteriorhodopsin